MNNIQFDLNEKRFIYMGRYSDFTPEIKKNFEQRSKGKAICHRVSFYLMASGLLNAMNWFLKNPEGLAGEVRAKNSCSYVIGMILAVTGRIDCFCEERGNMTDRFFAAEDAVLAKYKGGINEICRMLTFVAEQEVTEELLDWMMVSVEGYLNRVLDLLNNEPYNLKLGNASWNSSIGSAFDIFEGYTVEDDRFQLSYYEDSKVITLLKNATLGGGENFDQSALYLYTAVWEGKTFIYCSGLEMPLRSMVIAESDKPVMYYDYVKGQWWDFRE